ncbi:putative RNA-directed RNA polymerase [Aspergillus steynii IBT 23096]|uniref:RNA-dependent RNA polymerase n=1 Tax=Aspergillus steynii IBT 23096 TaxID=1392250 RepID=A0A2I2FZA8_9EURO|nr:putative RNA-directed RNA polymerase [Aspergillus steynii IBT 23096]PLB45957.1 putative RNA-directed RNA polymerase [Aspergillus steynii IBT 23096]
MPIPRTPERRTGPELHKLIDSLNDEFELEIPNPQFYSPSVSVDKNSLQWQSYHKIKRLYFARSVDLNELLNNFEEWVVASRVTTNAGHRMSNAAGAVPGPSNRDLLMGEGYWPVSQEQRNERLKYLVNLINDELYMLGGGSFVSHCRDNEPLLEEAPCFESRKRRLSEDEVFHTAPNSPVKRSPPLLADGFQDATFENLEFSSEISANSPVHVSKTPKTSSPAKGPSKFVEKLTAPDNYRRYDAVPPAKTGPEFSFTSTVPNTSVDTFYLNRFDTSFVSNGTELTEPMPDSESVYEDSVVGHLLSQEMRTTFEAQQPLIEESPPDVRYSFEQDIMSQLLNDGPFSHEHCFSASVPLRYRYELERIGRAWNVPLDRMLVGNNVPFKSREAFWNWIETHNQRGDKPLPEKSPSKAWDAAVGDFTTDKHSEDVALTGDLEWCSDSEPGILNLTLNPLRTERTCRFHRRFGSDRFLSLTVPAPARPPRRLRMPAHPSLLRESMVMWLQQNSHQCLGRTWKAFYLEEVKSKRKMAEPRFRVEFFAIDGVDFDHTPLSPPIAPREQGSANRTEMNLDTLLEWHMPFEANRGQTNCKLFQRLSLGLSKTFATVPLKPTQVLHLRDGSPVMNDGCALMSRALANQICDSLGLTDNTPSCFQGRIAGAKGLWMVDRHQSHVSAGDDDVWIQISDSQLKIKPHPQTWQDPIDEEQLTFEVVKWSKPLHSVHLNIQLLAILEHGGYVSDHIADLTRLSIQSVYKDFAEVVQSDNPVLCRNLIQKIKPVADDGSKLLLHKARRMEQWMMNESETLIRLTEAGFTPRSFYPLRHRLGKCLRKVLDRHMEELHIEVPLSTYAFCIADPYGVLKEDEVHFGLSANWRDGQGQFEDNLLDGVDVLVGRLPAHLPSDIQRRKAVWKSELRHFKDVIVFPTAGKIPLAHMLSGGDYDGDTPWICWDQNIVKSFRNSDMPEIERPPEYFGVTNHAVPMREISTWDEFLQSAMTFNMMLSNLGRCTVEREKLGYDQSIDSPDAMELSCLLSHLVDGRKSGDHLSKAAWQKYRKKISPKVRELPAYKNPDRKPKISNIIDYLQFQVVKKERNSVLRQLEKAFPENENMYSRDEALVQPWNEARKQADQQGRDGPLHAVLETVAGEIDGLYRQYGSSFGEGGSFSAATADITDRARTIPPPASGGHPLIYAWQHNPDAWQQLLASYTYKKRPSSSFWIHAFGEVLCQMKANSLPSRTVVYEVLSCYRVNPKAVARLSAQNASEEDEDDGEAGEYEGHEAIEAMLYGTPMQALGGYYDPDDSMSVE